MKHTPELKGATFQDRVDTVFGSQQACAQKLIDTLRNRDVAPKDAWVQSFNLDDVLSWIENEPAFGRQAVYLDDIDPTGKAIRKDSDVYKSLDVLARKEKILGIFSDWPATVTYYANCMGLR